MTCPAILSLEDFRDTPRRGELRHRLHDRFDHWLNLLEDRMKAPPPTLEELTQAILALRQEVTQEVTEGLVAHTPRARLEQRPVACPQCGPPLVARGPQERPVETLVGAVRLRRPDFDCEPCQRGTAPLDEALPLTEPRKQSDVQQAAVKLTKELADATACELWEELTGLPLRAHTAHEVTQGVAAGGPVLAVAPSREALAARIAAVATGQAWRPMLGLAMDGAAVPTRPATAPGRRPGHKQARATRARWTGAWREAKGGRFDLLADERLIQGRSGHQVQPDEEVAEALRPVNAAGLIPEDQGRLGVMADGALWLWKQVQALFPSAVELGDDYHCGEHLSKVATRQYGDHPERPQEWYEAPVARLCWGEVHGVIWGVQRMQPTDAQAAEEITQLIGSLQRHQERRDDRFARTGGLSHGERRD